MGNPIKVLHIATGYEYSSLYKKLFSNLEKNNQNNTVFVPQHISSIKVIDSQEANYQLIRKEIIKSSDRLFYHRRINKVFSEIEDSVILDDFSLIHAHSLFSDGGPAYLINQQYNIPYIVAIRDTDINKYFKYYKYLKPFALKILNNASQIVFLSSAYRKQLLEKFPQSISSKLITKCSVIPNGIDPFWHANNDGGKLPVSKNARNLLFVGQIVKRKNVETVIKSAIELNKNMPTNLEIVGEGDLLKALKKKYKSEKNIKFVGKVNKIDELKRYYRENDILIVPSYTETFGLVYAESISNGTPVIYTRNQGFDKYFSDGIVGYPTEPTDVMEIISNVHRIYSNYEEISKEGALQSKQFDWDLISNKYINIYSEIIL